MSRSLKWLAFGVALACVGPAGAQYNSRSPSSYADRVGQVITVRETGRPAEPCVVMKSWNMPDGTPAMLVSSQQTGEQMMIVPGTGAERFRVFRMGKSKAATAPADAMVGTPSNHGQTEVIQQVTAPPTSPSPAPAPVVTTLAPTPPPAPITTVPPAVSAPAPVTAPPAPPSAHGVSPYAPVPVVVVPNPSPAAPAPPRALPEPIVTGPVITTPPPPMPASERVERTEPSSPVVPPMGIGIRIWEPSKFAEPAKPVATKTSEPVKTDEPAKTIVPVKNVDIESKPVETKAPAKPAEPAKPAASKVPAAKPVELAKPVVVPPGPPMITPPMVKDERIGKVITITEPKGRERQCLVENVTNLLDGSVELQVVAMDNGEKMTIVQPATAKVTTIPGRTSNPIILSESVLPPGTKPGRGSDVVVMPPTHGWSGTTLPPLPGKAAATKTPAENVIVVPPTTTAEPTKVVESKPGLLQRLFAKREKPVTEPKRTSDSEKPTTVKADGTKAPDKSDRKTDSKATNKDPVTTARNDKKNDAKPVIEQVKADPMAGQGKVVSTVVPAAPASTLDTAKLFPTPGSLPEGVARDPLLNPNQAKQMKNGLPVPVPNLPLMTRDSTPGVPPPQPPVRAFDSSKEVARGEPMPLGAMPHAGWGSPFGGGCIGGMGYGYGYGSPTQWGGPQAPMASGFMPPQEVHAVQNTAFLMNVLQSSTQTAQRAWAASRLAVLDPARNPYVVEALRGAAKGDTAPMVRVAAIQALVQMKAESPVVLATLEQARSDRDPRVRDEAEQALIALAPDKGASVIQAGHAPQQ